MTQTKYIVTIAVLAIVWAISLGVVLDKNKSMEKKWKDAVENNKAYEQQFSSSEEKNRVLKLTVSQLNYAKDSILEKLNETRKELKIKDSKLQSLQYVASDFSKADTIIFSDTLFRDNQIYVDTLLSDEWYSVKVGLKYPSTIAVAPKFKSEKHIVVSAKKETVNPPKRFFLWRWLQKKHTVLNIEVVEKNPYVVSENNRYIEIVK